MKKSCLWTLLAGTIVLASCSSQKQAVSDYQYKQWKEQQAQQSQQSYESQPAQPTTQPVTKRPARTLRAAEPCIELALEDAENLRAYGTAISYLDKTAFNEAERDARNRLAAMIEAAIEGAAEDYEQNASRNGKISSATLGESVMRQFVNQEIKNTRTIKNSVYDVEDGTVQVYVCIEMKSDKSSFDKQLDNTLSREGLIELQYDRDRFIQKTTEGLQEYKRKQAERAAE